MTKTTLNRGGEGGNLYVPLGVRLWPINYETGQSVSTVFSEVVAKVSPIHKTGERNDANNHRPISVLPTMPRIFEKLIYEQLYDYLSKNDILDSRQSGFRSLHSTGTAATRPYKPMVFQYRQGHD